MFPFLRTRLSWVGDQNMIRELIFQNKDGPWLHLQRLNGRALILISVPAELKDKTVLFLFLPLNLPELPHVHFSGGDRGAPSSQEHGPERPVPARVDRGPGGPPVLALLF